MNDPVRLSKRLAEQLGCSRRDAELYIEGGWVRVDGAAVEEPQHRVAPAQKVELLPGARCEPLPPVTLFLHKPPGLGAARDDDVAALRALLTPAARAADDASSGPRMLRKHFTQLALCAPIEDAASGLVVLSQDSRVLRKFHDDGALIEHEVIAEVRGSLSSEDLQKLGRSLPALKVSWQNEQRLRFAIKGPAPGQVAALCRGAGLEVVGIKRIRIGRVPMAGLAVGQWRYLGLGMRF